MASQRGKKAQKRSLERPATAPENISSNPPTKELLFSGLHFYFFPNSRTNRARALRIDKAIQYGASFSPRWSPRVTHVIVDDGIPFEEFTKYHKDIQFLPDHTVVVNGRYVADCVSYGVILAHGQRLYQVPGNSADQAANSKLQRTVSEPSKKDTKSAGNNLKRILTDQSPSKIKMNSIETQEYNSIVGLIGHHASPSKPCPPIDDDASPAISHGPTVYDDELVSIIDETKAIRHLPIETENDEPILPSSPVEATILCIKSGDQPMHQKVTMVTPAITRQNSMIMQRPSDGQWVKLRCKECGETSFEDVGHFLKHCAFLHKQRFKTQDEAIEQCGFPLQAYKSLDLSTVYPPVRSAEGNVETTELRSVVRDEETQEPPTKRVKPSWQEQFVCMGKHDGSTESENPNANTIERLQEMSDFYERTNDRWRSLSFRRGISSLKKQTDKISTKKEALKLPFVGESIAEAIEKIVQTGQLTRLKETKEDPLNKVLELFMGIYGVGLSQATKWASAGFGTLDDLRDKAQLNVNQRIGLEHYDDLQQRIPRNEVEAHSDAFKHALAAIDPAFEVTVGGSYRRGNSTSGDIDLIITKPETSLHQIRSVILEQLVPELFAIGFLKAELARTSSDTGSKWHGCSTINNGPWRRIDFLLVPWDEMGAALIYFTGNDIFNRSIRLLAGRKGMRLNQRGLYRDVLRGRVREKVTDGELLESKSEKKIFEILGVPWRPPEHRNC